MSAEKTQSDFIKNIVKSGLENDQESLLAALTHLIEHSRLHNRTNFALQLQSILKDAIRIRQTSGMAIVDSPKHLLREEDRDLKDLILEKLTSDYRFNNLVCTDEVREELELFVQEHQSIDLLNEYNLPVSNKILFHGPPGCGKTLASYVLAGELSKLMIVVNLGAIVSSKLGETSKNLAKIFRRATSEECIIFIDEFDSLGKVRDFSQDHGEMKRVVNTILQLFDYIPQRSIVIAATNHISMIDEALLRRFDLKIKLDLPDKDHICTLINKLLSTGYYEVDDKAHFNKVITQAAGLSYYSIQKSLINTIKRSLFSSGKKRQLGKKHKIDTKLWLQLINAERAKKN